MRSSGFHHVDLVVSDIERSVRFYRTLLEPLGWRRLTSNDVGERGETIHYLYGPGSALGLRQAPEATRELPFDRYRIGLNHVAFEAAAENEVDRAAQRGAKLGATITDGPRAFPEYVSGYYAVFLRDPDGIKLEVVATPPQAYRHLGLHG
jgi:glyoxylase I family protein